MRPFWLLVFVASVLLTYGVFFTGEIVSGDNVVQYYQTVQIVDRHRLSFSTPEVAAILHASDSGLNTRFGVNRDQLTYTQVHGVGQPLMALPLFVLARSIKDIAHLTRPSDLTLWCLNWLVFGVLAVLLIMGACQLLGVPGTAWTTLITLSAAFASPIWMYSSIPYNVVGEMLVILAAIDLCLWFDANEGPNEPTASVAAAGLGAALAFGVAVRPFLVTAVPAFLGWFLYSQWKSAAPRVTKRRVIAAFSVAFLLGAAALAGFNEYYFGALLTSAYHDLDSVMNFGGSWAVGFAGTFLSPLKSPLFFFPLVIILPMALAVLLWRRGRVAWFVVIFLLPQVYLIPKYSMWDGGPDLFARFWLRVTPIVFLSLAAAVPHVHRRRLPNAGLFIVTGCLAVLGIRAQMLTTMTDERQIYAHLASDLAGRPAGATGLEYHDSVGDLVVGRTVVATAQLEAIDTPRRFLWFRSVPSPRKRLWVALAGLVASTWSLANVHRR